MQKKIFLRLLFALFLIPSNIFAKEIIGLYEWQPFTSSKIKIIMPLFDDLSPKESALQYVERLKSLPIHHLGPILHKSHIDFNFEEKRFRVVSRHSKVFRHSKRPAIAIISNRLGHMLPGDPFPFVRKKIKKYGGDPYIVPLRIDLVCPLISDKNHFFEFLAKYIHSLLSIGGADISPCLYKNSCSKSLNTFHKIDDFEHSLLKYWYEFSTKPVFGICRGHQMIAVLFGAKLIEDLSSLKYLKIKHFVPLNNSGLSQETLFTSEWHSADFIHFENILFKSLKKEKIFINSRHHQGVLLEDIKKIPKLKAVLVSENIVEAMEIKDKRGFTVQFHPEDMNTCIGNKIMQEIVEVSTR